MLTGLLRDKHLQHNGKNLCLKKNPKTMYIPVLKIVVGMLPIFPPQCLVPRKLLCGHNKAPERSGLSGELGT